MRKSKGDILLFLDADLEDSVIYARSLLFPVLMAHADMGIADFIRVNNKKAGFGFVKGLARAGIRYFTSSDMRSPLSGQHAITKALAKKLIPFASGYGVEVGLTIRAICLEASLFLLE